MRVWHLAPAYLDDQRLRAAHREIHKIAEIILAGARSRWYHVNFFRDKTNYLCYVHSRLEYELTRRNQGHEITPFPLDPWHMNEWEPSAADLRKDVIDLRAKWEREEYYFGIGRVNLAQAERSWCNLPVGPSHEWVAHKRELTKELRRQHAGWFRSYLVTHPKNKRVQDQMAAFRAAHACPHCKDYVGKCPACGQRKNEEGGGVGGVRGQSREGRRSLGCPLGGHD